jgi:hypothetical protein
MAGSSALTRALMASASILSRCVWQTSRRGVEKIASRQVEIKRDGDVLQVATVTRGLSEDEDGYRWSGEMRLWDNEILLGWYGANDGSIRSKGTMYFALHLHGLT